MYNSSQAFLINHAWACWAPEGNDTIVVADNGTSWINETQIKTIDCNYLYFKQTKYDFIF